VSKYVTKATDSRDLVPWLAHTVDVETGEITAEVVAGRYRTWSMSRDWGSTMAEVRAASAVYARLKADQAADRDLELALDLLLDSLGGVPEPAAGDG
jgi:hypothetical protein